MLKYLVIAVTILSGFSVKAQTPTPTQTRFPALWIQYRDTASRRASDTLCFFNQPNTSDVYYYGNSGNWKKLAFTTGSGSVLSWSDTGRLNGKIATAFALNKVRDSLQTNITGKLNISDTAAMLSSHATKSETLTGKSISGSSNIISNIANSSLTNSSITIGSTVISLGSTASTLAGLSSITSTNITVTTDLYINSLPTSTIPYVGGSGRLVGNINKLSFDTTQGFLAVNTGNPLSTGDFRGSASTTDAFTFNGNRTLAILNTNATNNNVTVVALRTVDGAGLVYSGVELQAINSSHTAGSETSGYSVKTRSIGTLAERMYLDATTVRFPMLNSSGTKTVTVDASGNLGTTTTLSGTVTSINITGANGVSSSGGPVTTSGSITVGLGNITPSSVSTAGSLTVTGYGLFGTYDGGAQIPQQPGYALTVGEGSVGGSKSIYATGNILGGTGTFGTTSISSSSTNALTLDDASSTYGQIALKSGGTIRGYHSATSSYSGIIANSSGVNTFLVDNTGRAIFRLTSGNNGEVIEISRSAGSYAWKIGVDAAASYFNFYNNGGTSVAHIDPSTGAYTATSDTSLKQNLRPSENALATLMNIPVVQYDWKENGVHEPWGLPAQQLYEITPTYVSKPSISDSKTKWGTQKAEMVPMVIKSVQELNQKYEDLKAEFYAYKQTHQ